MDKLQQQIDTLNSMVKKHGKYTQFSGLACVITGILWLANEGMHMYLQLTPNYRVMSWVAVAVVSILIASWLTVYETHKKGKEAINLPLFSVIDKLIMIGASTSVLLYVFYRNDMVMHLPGLLMTMYGVLIVSAKLNITSSIIIFGYLNLAAGFAGLLFPEYALYIAAAVLGLGHIVLGIVLKITNE
ncbi:hypothetical protein ACFL3T_00325 [Patescibacteria group bacterium]